MPFRFDKFQGTGNDFIIADDWQHDFPVDNKRWINHLCNRKFGIGADGLILLQPHSETDYRMIYFNADGNESSMCGNGGRCIAQFAYERGYAGINQTFTAVDGLHHAQIKKDTIALTMQSVSNTRITPGGYYWMDTGSPHLVSFQENNDEIDVKNTGRSIRNGDQYNKHGINVNFVNILAEQSIHVRTYERGVEDETLSCGTGVVASAIAYYFQKGDRSHSPEMIDVRTPGGTLTVHLEGSQDDLIENIWLEGPAVHVFHGTIDSSGLNTS